MTLRTFWWRYQRLIVAALCVLVALWALSHIK